MGSGIDKDFVHGATLKPAWHNMFQTFEAGISAEEAAKRAGLLWNVSMLPISAFSDTYGWIEVPDRVALVREPTVDDPVNRTFAVVSTDFEFMQNLELVRLFNQLTDQYPIESIGTLGKGDVLFASFDAGMIEVGGKCAVQQYIGFYQKLDGLHRAKWMCTPVVQVCANTCAMAQRGAVAQADIIHKIGFTKNMEFKTHELAKLGKMLAFEQELFGNLAATHLDFNQVKAAIEAVYPTPSEPVDKTDSDAVHQWLRACAKVKSEHSSVMVEYLQTNELQPGLENTAWSLWNGFTSYENHEAGNKPESIMFGAASNRMNAALDFLSRPVVVK